MIVVVPFQSSEAGYLILQLRNLALPFRDFGFTKGFCHSLHIHILVHKEHVGADQLHCLFLEPETAA